jgi:hypothetical protein
MTVPVDQPLIGVIRQSNGTEVVDYTTDDSASPRPTRVQSIRRALELAGAWSDLDFDNMLEALDRIRHQSKPTPPIDLEL